MDKFKTVLRMTVVMMVIPAIIFIYGYFHHLWTGRNFDLHYFMIVTGMLMSLPWMAAYIAGPLIKFIMGIKD